MLIEDLYFICELLFYNIYLFCWVTYVFLDNFYVISSEIWIVGLIHNSVDLGIRDRSEYK